MPDFLLEDETGGVVAGVDEAGRGRGSDRWLPGALFFWTGKLTAGC